MRAAREVLAAKGLTTSTRDGGEKLHPAARVEAESRIAFARLLRELDLDVTAPTIFHCHVHLIPRRAGDVGDPSSAESLKPLRGWTSRIVRRSVAVVGVEGVCRLRSEHVKTASPLQRVVHFVGGEPHLAQLKTKAFFGEERRLMTVRVCSRLGRVAHHGWKTCHTSRYHSDVFGATSCR